VRGVDLTAFARSIETVLCVGAHPDDVEIGAGGTLLTLLEANPRLAVTWIVLSGSERRAQEARCAAEMIMGPGRPVIKVFGHRESYFPYEGGAVKATFDDLGRRAAPDLVLTHHRGDLHQDHRVVSELTWNTFRDNLILEYEIPKFDGDLGTPNLFVPIERSVCDRKVDLLMRAFVSQRTKPWFTEETFRATLRLRGIESRSPSGYAEGFHVRKLVLAGVREPSPAGVGGGVVKEKARPGGGRGAGRPEESHR
jgi:LmbE family N-acetylglucosaminyl deacetylase